LSEEWDDVDAVSRGGFEGSISKQFNATAIPATFTIDADGVLEDQHVAMRILKES